MLRLLSLLLCDVDGKVLYKDIHGDLRRHTFGKLQTCETNYIHMRIYIYIYIYI